MGPPRSDMRILVIEDDSALLAVVGEMLRSADYVVDLAPTGDEGLALAAEHDYDAALIDLRLGRETGLDVMERLKTLDSHVEVIITTGFATIETAVMAMTRGAFHYLSKPIKMPELLLLAERAARKARDAREKELLLERLRREQGRWAMDGFVAESPALRTVIDEARDVAELEKPVYIYGETGTGKELLARYIHRASDRRDGPFNAINCGTLTENLVDSELFGYEKGAFTGADRARPGIVAASEKGTLFLDEIGDIPAGAQLRLLRFLESGTVRALGSHREVRHDVRVIAASHKDLAVEMREGRFREDLYHRLVVFELRLPPLRQRPEDIHPLARLFLADIAKHDHFSLAADAVALLEQQPWSGNIRELRNEVERAFLRARRRSSTVLQPQDFRLSREAPEDPTQFAGYGPIPLDQADMLHVRHVLTLHQGNRRKAASALGISERHLYRLLRGGSGDAGDETDAAG